jgi:predicted amidophosphoribosyltransferase
VVETVAPAMADVLRLAPPFAGHVLPTDRPERGWSITWVPLGRRRRRSRGFDQAEVLARAVAHLSGMSVLRLLDRPVETAPQARRAASERALALHGSFRVVRSPPEDVVLVDDVLTSGATGAECARTLLRAGARRVGLLTAARSMGGVVPGRCYNPPGLRPGSVVARETISR